MKTSSSIIAPQAIAHLSSIHLSMITTLKEMFPNYIIAFSDHSPGADMDIAAVALGWDVKKQLH